MKRYIKLIIILGVLIILAITVFSIFYRDTVGSWFVQSTISLVFLCIVYLGVLYNKKEKSFTVQYKSFNCNTQTEAIALCNAIQKDLSLTKFNLISVNIDFNESIHNKFIAFNLVFVKQLTSNELVTLGALIQTLEYSNILKNTWKNV